MEGSWLATPRLMLLASRDLLLAPPTSFLPSLLCCLLLPPLSGNRYRFLKYSLVLNIYLSVLEYLTSVENRAGPCD